MNKQFYILLAEDKKSVAELLKGQLNKLDLDIHTTWVKKKKTFLKKLDSKSPDLVICDFKFSGITGLEALNIVRKKNPELPFILIAGELDEHTAMDIMLAGVSDYVLKEDLNRLAPVVLRELVNYRRLKKKQQLLDKAYQLAEIGHWELDVKNSNLYWSPSIKKLHEVDQDYEPDLESALNFYKEGEHRKTIRKVVNDAIEMGKSFNVELLIITAEGNERWIRAVGETEFENGKCVRIYGSTQNIDKRKRAEESLRLREQRFKSLIQDGSDLISILDSDGNYKYASPNAERTTGLGASPEDFIGHNCYDFIHEDDHERIRKTISELPSFGRAEIAPYRLQVDDGPWRWLETTLTNLTDNPAVQGYVANTRDVTDRIEQEKELRESVERFKILSKATNDVIWDWNLKTSQVLWNDALRSKLGYKKQQTKSEWWYEHIHPDDREKVVNRVHYFIEQGIEYWSDEYRFRLADGTYKIFFDRGYLQLDEDGNAVRMIGSMQDITDRKEYEEKLKELSLVASKTTDVIIITDQDDKIKWVNSAYEELTGFTLTESIGRNPGDLLQGPETDPETVQRLSKAVQNRESIQEVILNYSKTGEKYWLDITIDPIFDADDSCSGFIAIEKDVTEQMERENKLRESVERFEIVSKATSDTIWDLNLETNMMQYNQNIFITFGYSRKDVKDVGQWWQENIHPDDRSRVLNRLEKALSRKTDRFQLEYRFRCSDGSYKYIYDRAFIVTNAEGEPVRVIGAMQDVTRKKEEEQWLRVLESAVATTTESILILEARRTDQHGRKVLYVNDAFSEMTGYSREYAVGITPHFLNGPETDEAELKKLRKKMDRWENCESEFINYKKNGDAFWINVSMSPVKDDEGNYSHWVCVGRDITERKKREKELKESLKEKEVLLTEIHHRVKNNLAVVSGIMQLQAFDEEDEGLQKKLYDSVVRIQTMGTIHELLYQSKNFSKVFIDETIEKLVTNITNTFRVQTNVETTFDMQQIELNINQAIPCSLIVNEIITNILKHAFEGRKNGTITVTTCHDDENICLEIGDDGNELPPNFNSSMSSSTLGLKLVDTLSKQLDADYEYRSFDQGTSFKLTFKKAETKGIGNINL